MCVCVVCVREYGNGWWEGEVTRPLRMLGSVDRSGLMVAGERWWWRCGRRVVESWWSVVMVVVVVVCVCVCECV